MPFQKRILLAGGFFTILGISKEGGQADWTRWLPELRTASQMPCFARKTLADDIPIS